MLVPLLRILRGRKHWMQWPLSRNGSDLSRNHGTTHFPSFSIAAAVLLTLAVFLWRYSGQWDETIRLRLQARLAETWPGLHVSIRSARHVNGRGFEIRGLQLQPSHVRGSGTTPSLDATLFIDEVWISCANSLAELLSDQVQISGLICRRPTWRSAHTQWKHDAWSIWLPVGSSDRAMVPVQIEDGRVEIVWDAAGGTSRASFREIRGNFRPAAKGGGQGEGWQLDATLASDCFRRGNITFQVKSAKDWDLTVQVVELSVASDKGEILPGIAWYWLPPMASIQANGNVRLQVARRPEWPDWTYRLDGRISQGKYLDPRWAQAISDIGGEFRVDPQQMEGRNVSARIGPAYVHGTVTWPLTDRGTPQLDITAERVALDDSLVELLPPDWAATYRVFQPRGEIDARCQLRHDGKRWYPTCSIHGRRLSFAWRDFPLPVDQGTGTLAIQDDTLSFDLAALALNRPFQLRGVVQRPGEAWTGWCEYEARQPIPLDDRLISSLPERFQRGPRKLDPSGSFLVSGRIDRQQPRGPVDVASSIEIVDGMVRPSVFPYPLYDLRGYVEQRGSHWTFRDLTAKNDSARIRANGEWISHPQDGGVLRMQAQVTQLAFEEELRLALSPSVQRLWKELRPEGVIDTVEVTYQLDTASRERQLQIFLDSRTNEGETSATAIALQPLAFPYRLEELTGRMHYCDGRIQMENMRTQHGRVQLTTHGTATYHPDGQWELHLTDLLADRCRPDRELLTALPQRLRRMLDQTKASGEVALRGELHLFGKVDEPSQSHSSWNLSMDVADGVATTGVSLRGLSGEAQLVGEANPQSYFCRGELSLDSVMAEGVHCTNVRGPIWIDQDRIYLGDWGPFTAKQAGAESTSAKIPPLRADVLGGVVHLNAAIVPARDSQFDVQATAERLQINQLVRDLGMLAGPSRGLASASFRLEGDARGTATWRGAGNLQIRETDLYKLPVTLALLKQMRTGSSDRTAFDAADLAVRMQGQHLYFDRIDLHGDTITLKGVGEMSLRRDIHLNFYTMMGREDSYLPAVRPLLGLASQRFLLVRVGGTLDQPVTSREILPGINDTLTQLFPELLTTASDSTAVRTASGP